MYISTKHYLQSVVYVYDEETDAVRRGQIKAINIRQNEESTDTFYAVLFTGESVAVQYTEEVIFDNAASAFYTPDRKAFALKMAAEAAAKAEEATV